jgi:Fic family protein
MKNRLDDISRLFEEFQKKKIGKESLLNMLDEAEIPERVYNSNAIENSTLTLPETEKILLQMEVSKKISLREIFEAKNLALVYGYIKKKINELSLSTGSILLLHKMLLTNIRDGVAGRFRVKDEIVQVGTHIAVPGEFVAERMNEIIIRFNSDIEMSHLHKVARFHAEFENIHPFLDGNGRIGRVINNLLLMKFGFPPMIIRNKEKETYYQALRSYDASHTIQPIVRIFEIALLESLHKRIAYLDGSNIILLTEYAKKQMRSPQSLLNAARRQTIPAFREKGVWKIGV